jgi:hypothetical protein
MRDEKTCTLECATRSWIPFLDEESPAAPPFCKNTSSMQPHTPAWKRNKYNSLQDQDISQGPTWLVKTLMLPEN